ncbi:MULTISPECIES: sugar transferase [Microbacterium]|uniref:sugar transferase n=1 Tax=Microbacterium TaxID=33882 RepID=UPI001E5D7F38|nr:sugar transferase [Microbacterium nymphoidis]MCD2498719.1 sugar transferase [Microbacterium nymphoidis]
MSTEQLVTVEPEDSDANAIASARAEPLAPRRATKWAMRYARRLFVTDVIVITVLLTAFGLFGLRSSTLAWPGGPKLPYAVPLLLVAVLWLVCLEAFETRDRHIVGDGVVEYRRIISATVFVFAVVISLAFFLRIDVTRALFVIVLPAGLLGLLLSRWLWRQWLRKRQWNGTFVFRAVLLGEKAKIQHIARQIRRIKVSGYVIVGAITPDGTPSQIGDVPVLGALKDTVSAVDRTGADTLIVGGSDELDPNTMRRLGWAMADRDVNWVVAPALTDVAGPRIHARPVAGLPLVHVDFPRLEGYRRVVKRTFDIVAGSVMLVLALPVMLVTAIVIRAEGPGPVIYAQERVGRHGKTFHVLKFRSMVPGADAQLPGLLDQQGTAGQPFFKVADDPRITKVGKFIRRHSIDELPQLFNVLRGNMSLVGPRPQVASEVALYEEGVERRLLVKPGMSGLWQVSGRSKLSAEDSIRFDLYYVENWSFAQDLQILFRTFKAVVAPGKTAH